MILLFMRKSEKTDFNSCGFKCSRNKKMASIWMDWKI